MKIIALPLSVFFLTVLPASAQIIVVGKGLARTCFENALFANSSHNAIEVCSKALDGPMSRQNRIATHVNRGVLLMRAGEYDRAISDYDRSLAMDDQRGQTYINKGAALIYKGLHEDALSILNTAIELDSPDLHAAYYNRALAHEAQGDLTSAYWDFQKALELKPEWELAEAQIDRFIVETTG